MTLNLAFFVLMVVLAIYMLITEIFTLVFMMTGLSHTRSVFQVISLLTNSGFTTNESEVIVSSRKRRKLAIAVMVIGHLMNVLVFSVIINLVLTVYTNPTFNYIQALLAVIGFLLIVITYKKVPFIKTRSDRIIKKMANRWMYNRKDNPLLILDNFHGHCIVEVKIIEIPFILKDTTIFHSALSDTYGIRVLFIKRQDSYIGHIAEDEVIHILDRVIVFGPIQNIKKIFDPNQSGSSQSSDIHA